MKTQVTLALAAALLTSAASLQAADSFVAFHSQPGALQLYPAAAIPLVVSADDYPGVLRAARTLGQDIALVTGREAATVQTEGLTGSGILIGSLDRSPYIQQLVRRKAIDKKTLQGCREKYLITQVDASQLDRSLTGMLTVIAGSDKRGTEYGIYELSRQLGVSPWTWWADMPVTRQDSIYLLPGTYTDGEPVVRYRGIFLNDEAPCLSGWVNEKFPDAACENLPVDPSGHTYARGFNHLFYEHVFELLLRLKGNYLWPAMWGNAFYYDDPLNGPLADEMGIIMGTSHHEPMARNHQEWVRYKRAKMQEAGARTDDEAPAEARWDYAVNQTYIDQFFREGIERARGTEDLITIGMRGDGDTGLGGKEGHDDETVSRDEYNKQLLERVIRRQRQIIADVTGKKADRTPQMWALYKEVQHLYDLGLDVPDDVLIMLCDDNWGDIRRVPEANVSATRTRESLMNRRGGWGMYYHVDYVGAPRNTKWANVTTTDHLWEQMRLCYEYGIDDLWILNVGDLKPMEQPIDLFLQMAWNPDAYVDEASVHQQALQFLAPLASAFTGGDLKSATLGANADLQEMTRLLETYLRYNSRCTPELLTAQTYDLASGEWERAMLQYKALETDALRLYGKLYGRTQVNLSAESAGGASAYCQLILYPIQSMANLYEMYYAQAQNLYLASLRDPRANQYADQVERCFARDAELTQGYHSLNGGKWNHLMDQTHIGYTSWQQPDRQVCPHTERVAPDAVPANLFVARDGYVSIEAEHYAQAQGSADGAWTLLPTLGRTLSGVALLPHNASCEGASLTYTFQLPEGQPLPDSLSLHVITNSTLPFLRIAGHRYTLQLNDSEPVEVNYNSELVEDLTYKMYAVAATRIVETVTALPAPHAGLNTVTIRPLDPGLVIEHLVIDLGGYTPQYLKALESPRQ